MKLTRFLPAVSFLLLFSLSCGKAKHAPREKTFLIADPPSKVSTLAFPRLARTSRGDLLMSLFIHSTFPTATEPSDAISLFQSEDDGASWLRLSNVPSFNTTGVWGCDLAIDQNDRLYLTWVAGVYDATARRTFKAIMFSRSDDSGRTWTPPLYVNDSLSGQRSLPQIAVSGENVYVAWLEPRRDIPPTPAALSLQDVYLASSKDRGSTWSANSCLEIDLDRKDSSSSAPSLCVGSDGTVYCAYFSIRKYEKNVGGFWIAKSTDRGGKFSIELQNVGPLGHVSLHENAGKLYLAAVYIRAIKSIKIPSPETYQELRLYTSSDGGKKWSKPVLIDDDQSHARKSNVRLLSAGPDKLIAAWHDDRGGIYMAASTDGGNSWGKNISVAGASPVGMTPLDMAVDAASGTFYLLLSHIVHGPGDATYLVKGTIQP